MECMLPLKKAAKRFVLNRRGRRTEPRKIKKQTASTCYLLSDILVLASKQVALMLRGKYRQQHFPLILNSSIEHGCTNYFRLRAAFNPSVVYTFSSTRGTSKKKS